MREDELLSKDLETALATARALGHPARLRTVAVLRSGELRVCQVMAVLDLAASTVSLHLRELKRCGVISARKEGRWVLVGLAEDVAARRWVDTALSSLDDDPHFIADARLVEELRGIPVEDLCRPGYDGARHKVCAAKSAPRSDEAPGGQPDESS